MGHSSDAIDEYTKFVSPSDLQTPDFQKTPEYEENENPLEVYLIKSHEKKSQEETKITLALLWSFKRVIFLCSLVSLSGSLFGYDTGTIGGIIHLESFIDVFAEPDSSNFKTWVQGLIISLYHIGAILGGFTLARLSDYVGRRIPIFLSMLVYIIGIIVQITSVFHHHWWQFAIGRFIAGLCIGSMGVLGPLFISETAPNIIRGSLTSLYQLSIVHGLFLGSLVIYLTKSSFDAQINNASWIIPLSLSIFLAICVCVALLFIPESARYLVSIGEIEKARSSLVRSENPNIEQSLCELKLKLSMESNAMNFGFSYMLKHYKKRLFLGISLMGLQQMSGIDYFFYFGVSLFKSIGIKDSYITSIILATVNLVVTIPSVFFVERYGRKRTLLVGSVASCICVLIYSTVGSVMLDLNTDDPEVNRKPGMIMIVFTCLFIISFSATWGSCANVLIAELYPIHIKAKAMALSISFNWGANFFIAFCTPIIVAKIHYYYGFVFTGCLFVSFWFVLFMIPETKGISLEEMDVLFEKKHVS